jgi:hypothetical protein
LITALLSLAAISLFAADSASLPTGSAAIDITAPIVPPPADGNGFVSWKTSAPVESVTKGEIIASTFLPTMIQDKKTIKCYELKEVDNKGDRFEWILNSITLETHPEKQ